MKGSYPADGRRRDHLSLERPSRKNRYTRPDRDMSGTPRVLDRVAHADGLLQRLAGAVADLERQRPPPIEGFESEAPPVVLNVSSVPGRAIPKALAGVQADIRIGALRRRPDASVVGAIVTAEKGVEKLEQSLRSFRDDPLTGGGEIPLRGKFEFLADIDARPLEALWSDVRPLPTDGARHWWHCWVWKDRRELFERAAEQLRCNTSRATLEFPEFVVVPLEAGRHELLRIVSTVGAIGDLRYARETPHFWTVEQAVHQHDWVADLARTTSWPEPDAPAVCLLDTGVNRGHPLIEPALSVEDLQAVRARWTGADDGLVTRHGTAVAGLALLGDLADALPEPGPTILRHRLESVKLIEGNGRQSHIATSYGVVTQAAIAMAEIRAPSRRRVICLAVTDDYSGEQPTPWSAALDQSACGVGLDPIARTAHEEDWPEELDNAERQERLIFVSAGNVTEVTTDPDADIDEYPIESPAQAWNVLSIGGVTDKTRIDGEDYTSYEPLADTGERSPFSRTSVEWPHEETAIKPELVLEAGNCGVDPAGEVHPDIDSLLLLSTSPDFVTRPLAPMSMTSAATPLAARMGAEVLARYPELWPETVRALLVHSARWTPAMNQLVAGAKVKGELRRHLRSFGYGVPDLERALFSFGNDLAIVTEQHIQPYRRAEGGQGGVNNEAHYFALPWPRSQLEALDNEKVEIRVTLSYFVEPNIGGRGNVDAAAYRSAGLRFDLKRAGESREDFFGYVNKRDRTNSRLSIRSPDERRVLGDQMICAGSLHSELWRGPAADFLDRDHLIVYPDSGWWRDLPKQNRVESSMRYALVVSLSTEEESVDLYSAVKEAIPAVTPMVDVEIE